MISHIKIYNGNGELQKEISKEEAKKLYNDNNKDAWDLSPTERKRWHSLTAEDTIPYERKGIRPWIKRTYKKQIPKHKIKCEICKKTVIMVSPRAKTCSRSCFNKRHHKNRRS